MKKWLNLVLSPQNVKRLLPQDAPKVEKLTLKNTEYLFGSTTPKKHLENCHLSLGICTEFDELVGVLCLNGYPNIPALPPWEWDYWLYNKYGITNFLPMNTLWVHYSVWDRRYTSIFLKPILQSLFETNEVLDQIVMVCPPGITRLDFIQGITTRIAPEGYSNPNRVQSLFIAKRADFVAQYVIRRAVEEDNDDLVAIIPKKLEEKYGQYYISELLSSEESTRYIIVAEHRSEAVGILVLNDNVNYEMLNEEFELVPYNGFKKHNVADEVGHLEGASTTILPVADDYNSTGHLSTLTLNLETKEELPVLNESDGGRSEDEFSLMNLSSSIFFDLLYEDDAISEFSIEAGSTTSIESHFSAVMLNEEYEDHLYNSEKGELYGDDKKLRRKESKQEPLNIPTFYGEANAFAMEICTCVTEHDNCLYLLFQAAFECFPDRDYIVVSFPTNHKPSYVAKHFVRVVPRASSVFDHELYVLHKSAIMGQLKVKPAAVQDRKPITELIAQLVKPSVVEEMFREAVEVKSSPLKAFTFFCEKQIIGCAIVSEEDDHEFLELHYNIDSWIDIRACRFGVFGNVEQFLISPIFQRHTSFFARELHRYSNFETLFYRLKQYDYLYTHRYVPLNNALSQMVPVSPNPLPEYSQEVLSEYRLPHVLRKHQQPFGLYLSTNRITSMRKIEINHRIVVIGAGATTISFLESLLFGKNLNYLIIFSNVTVVSPHGISYHKLPSSIREMVFVNDGHLDRRYMDSICLKTYVHVLQGVMTSINRKEKYVGLNDDSFLPYDYLFLLCGEQFQKPPLKRKEVVKKKTEFPLNVFIINTEADAGNAFNALKNLTHGHKHGNMVVFGHYLEACCCLAALLEFGVHGNNLVYVDPSPDHIPKTERHDHLTHVFNNSEVENAVYEEILLQGVTIYQDYNFVDWHMDSNKNLITSAKFESKYKFVDIELSALFIYHSKGVSTRTFQAIARSGLVFNGRLVIDKHFQTNDPYIYGAGPLTMYSKRYHAEHLMHKNYNPREVGYKLGKEVRRKLIPEEYRDPPEKPPKCNMPLVQHCIFPGNLHYLHVSKAGERVPLDVATIKCNYGRVLTTGDCKKLDEKGFFRLHLNQFQTVETITCLTKFELKVRNLISLWGKHEILLNHLLLRYDMHMIPDLFEFFDQPWACAIYHMNFPKVLDEISEMLSVAETTEGVKLVDEIREKLEKNEWNPLTKMQADEIEELCRDINIIPEIEKKILEFLHDNYMYLPMYAHQLLIRWILHHIQTSPLFVKCTFTAFNAFREMNGTHFPIPTKRGLGK